MLRLVVGLSLLFCIQGAEIRSVNLEQTILPEPGAVALPTSKNRDEKFLSVFQIIKFNNDMCNATDGKMGVCYTEAECTSAGGLPTGTCASAFGVCCVFTGKTCGSTVNKKVAYIESPNYPLAAPTGMCMYNVAKCDSGVCQYKIEFLDVVLSDPAMGDCNNDTLTITNLDAVSAAVVPTSLCGTTTGSEIYVTVNSTQTSPKLTFNIVSSIAHWRMKVTQLACSDTASLADPGCLTWNTGTSGTLSSFNNQAGAGELINNQKYSHCIKYQQGFCDVALSASDFMMGADDMITFGGNTQTGPSFGTAGSLLWNFTGPYVVPVMSGAVNTAMDTGYSISYLLLPC